MSKPQPVAHLPYKAYIGLLHMADFYPYYMTHNEETLDVIRDGDPKELAAMACDEGMALALLVSFCGGEAASLSLNVLPIIPDIYGDDSGPRLLETVSVRMLMAFEEKFADIKAGGHGRYPWYFVSELMDQIDALPVDEPDYFPYMLEYVTVLEDLFDMLDDDQDMAMAD